MKSIILCADDYGLNPAICEGIAILASQKRLSATSCMTTSSYWPVAAKRLQHFQDAIDIGLHFNLTEGLALGAIPSLTADKTLPPLKTVLIKSLLRKLDRGEIAAELNRQIDQFVKYMGKLPDFIDGHQHIHQFPVIRDALVKVYEQRFHDHQCYLRSSHEKSVFDLLQGPARLKRATIFLMGGLRFSWLLKRRQIPHNATFSGAYDFEQKTDYQHLFPYFLNAVDRGGLIMCHPALAGDNKNDCIAANRYNEFKYFDSDEFVQACYNHQVTLARFKDIQ